MAKWCATYLPELASARTAILAVLWIGLAGCAGRATDDGLPAVVDYNFHIKPILSDRCYACHGPDDEARQAELRLHEEDGAKEARLTSGGRAVVPGSLRRSKLYRRISARTAEERMPPAETNLSVSEHERALIARWIEQGAGWKPHWAFVPPTVPAIPESGDPAWPRNELDRFILDRLERHGLSPSPEAARETLLRRVTLDLTGLPPTLDEIDAFLADTSRQAYERVVDRLLAAPAYGEHMAAEWLDIARYADTHGYQADRDRRMWPWRDWVVSAFNDNMPFDEFGTWQLAGDLLPAATTEQHLATAFNRNHRQTNEGGSIEEEFRTEYVADRTNTAGTAFLGLTMECARCHDHKYDPISHEEYYRFFSFFSSIDESGQTSHFTDAVPVPALALPDEAAAERLEPLRLRIARAEASLQAARDMALPAYRRWAQDARPTALPSLPQKDLAAYFDFERLGNGLVPAVYPAGAGANTVFDPALHSGRAGRAITFDGENGAYFEEMGVFTAADPFTLSLWIHAPRYETSNVLVHRTQAALDAGSRGYELSMEDGHLVAQLAHMWPENAIRIISEHRVPLSEWVQVAMTYDGSSRAEGLNLYMDGERQQVRTVRNSLRANITYENLEVHLTMGYRFRDTGFKDGRIDDFRLYARRLTDLEVRQLAGKDALTPALNAPDEHEFLLLDFYLALFDPPYAAALEELRNARRQFTEAAAEVPEIMVMREMDKPRPVHVLRRGIYDEKGDVVLPGTPEALGAFPDTLPHNRLGLAKWIFSRDNPLTARVAVNPILAAALRYRARVDSRRFREPGCPAFPSGTPGLPGRGIHRDRLGCQGHASADSKLGHVPTVLRCFGGASGAGPGQPATRQGIASSSHRRNDPGPGPCGQRPPGAQTRRPPGQTLPAGRVMGGKSGHQLRAGHGRGPVPTEPLYILQAHVSAALHDCLRHVDTQPLHHAAPADDYADAGPGSAERPAIPGGGASRRGTHAARGWSIAGRQGGLRFPASDRTQSVNRRGSRD